MTETDVHENASDGAGGRTDVDNTETVDLLVLGGGTGNKVASAAASAGLETVLVEKGPLGGTCLNRGCNPSKMLIAHANRVNDVASADGFHVDAELHGVDVPAIVEEVHGTLGGIADRMADGKRAEENLTFRNSEGRFVDDRTVRVGDTAYTAEQVLVAAGTRPLVVDAIEGLTDVDYLTSSEALRLAEPPDRLVVMGGGYIAAELGYYFDALGTEVALIEMEDRLLPREDDEVADRFTEIARERHDVYTGYRVTAVSESNGTITATAEAADGDTVEVPGEELLVALGRRPNTDQLGIENTSLELDDRGFIQTDERLETSVDGVYASGDINGQHPFKHAADYEVEVAIENIVDDADRTVDYSGMSHAVFTEPQVAGVGQTEAQLQADGEAYVVGRAEYTDAAMSRALKIDDGLVKVLAAPDGELLGCHLVGHEASMLVHEATIAARNDVSVTALADTIHVHPSMNKVLASAFEDAASKL
jgi:mycothione reductase